MKLLLRLSTVAAACSILATLAPAAPRLLVMNGLFATMSESRPDPFLGHMLVDEKGVIVSIGEGAPPAAMKADQTLDAAGRIIMPGFISGHSHIAASVRRGRLPGMELDGLIDNPVPFFRAEFYAAGDLHAFALHGALDYLRHGITTYFEYPIRPRFLGEDLYREMFAAELQAGARFVYGYNVPDLPPAEARQAFLEFKAYAEQLAGGDPRYLRLALAKTGHIGRWGHDFFATEVAIAKEFGLDLQLHFLESNRYQMQNRADFTMMEQAGALEVGLIYGHFIHHSQQILDKSVAAGARMIWNPLSNGRLASGLADVPKYLKAGMVVGMGLDGQSTADLADPFENMRMGLYSLRMEYNDASILLPLDLLRLHTIGTARAIGVADRVGTLEPGKFADFLLVDTMEPDTGPVHDVYATLVFACSSDNVDTVFVGGEPVVRRKQPLKFDAAAVAREAHERVAAMRKRSETPALASGKP
ncbi:MAG: amidohydrolase family protein [Opitutaceae bacterium]|nr:amidohydrolase family protein [Opitutaceae bacterium]